MSGVATHDAALIDRILAMRARWIEVEPGKSVRLVRPAEVQVGARFVRPSSVPGQVTLNVELAEVQEFVTGWKGITEADIAGAAGASDVEPAFSRELWSVVVEDRADWMNTVAKGLLDLIVEHQQTRAAAAKN